MIRVIQLTTTLSVILRRQTDRNHPLLGKAADPLLTQETKTWRPHNRFKSYDSRYKRVTIQDTRVTIQKIQELLFKIQELLFKITKSYNSRSGVTTSSHTRGKQLPPWYNRIAISWDPLGTLEATKAAF